LGRPRPDALRTVSTVASTMPQTGRLGSTGGAYSEVTAFPSAAASPVASAAASPDAAAPLPVPRQWEATASATTWEATAAPASAGGAGGGGGGGSSGDLVTQLASRVGSVRLAAMEALGKMPPTELEVHLQTLVATLEDQEWQVRAAAAAALGSLRAAASQGVAAALARCSEDRHARLREACARAMGRLGVSEAAPRLGELLEDADQDVRREASRALGLLGPSPAAAPAAQRLAHSSAEVRAAAQRALLDAKRRVEEIGEEAAPGFSAAALAATLQTLRAHTEPLLTHAEPDARRAAAEVLQRLGATQGDRDLAVRCAVAVLHDASEEVRLGALNELASLGADMRGGGLGEAAAAALAGCLADDAPEVRLAAVRAIAQAAPAGAAPAVAELLPHSLQHVRRAAVAALVAMEGEAKDSHIVQIHLALLKDSSPQARCGAVESIAALGAEGRLSPEEVAAVAGLRIDPHWAVRRAAAEALRHFGPEAVRRHAAEVDQLLLDSDWRVRRSAAAARAEEQAAAKREAGSG